MQIQKIEDVSALAAMSRVEIDSVIATAKQYPRSIALFSDQAAQMTLSTVEFAAQSFYALPRAGKWLTGPSIRFAETLQHAWGNCRSAGRIVEEQEKYVVAQGVFIDLQANTMTSIEQKRRITDKEGNRYNSDMVMTTGNAAVSIALRNAILRGIPKALWSPIYSQIEGIITNPQAVIATREKALAYFTEKGVSISKVCAIVQVDKADDIGPKHIFLLRGLCSSIEDGETTVERAFSNARAVPNMPRERKAPKAETKQPKPATKPAKAETKKAKTETKAAKPETAKKNEPHAQVVKVSEKQRTNLFALASKKSADYDTVQKIVKGALNSFGFKDSYAVTIDKYPMVCAAIEEGV